MTSRLPRRSTTYRASKTHCSTWRTDDVSGDAHARSGAYADAYVGALTGRTKADARFVRKRPPSDFGGIFSTLGRPDRLQPVAMTPEVSHHLGDVHDLVDVALDAVAFEVEPFLADQLERRQACALVAATALMRTTPSWIVGPVDDAQAAASRSGGRTCATASRNDASTAARPSTRAPFSSEVASSVKYGSSTVQSSVA